MLESVTSITVKPCTPIPERFEWVRTTSTSNERTELLVWARSTADALYATDPDERDRLLLWSAFVLHDIVLYPEPEVHNRFLGWGFSTPTKEAPDQCKRLLKWAHSTARTAPDERKRWSLREEILKPFETALEPIQEEYKEKYPSHHVPALLNQEHIIYTFKGKHGRYECRDAVWIWSKYLWAPGVPRTELERGPISFGEKIKDNFPESDVIKGRPSVNKLGIVTIELSGKWIAESIHKMLKDGLYTWAPKLPVDRVAVVDRPSLVERTNVDLARRIAITYTLMSILEFSKADALTILGHNSKCFEAPLHRWFPCEEREGDVLNNGQLRVILPKTDSDNAYQDNVALWNQLCNWKADWIVYITPVWHHAYCEMCLAAAELEKLIPVDGDIKTAKTSYVGYQACNTAALENNLLEKARTRLGGAADFLGYRAEAILECLFKYTSLKNHRLAVCTFDINEMLNEEGNTFIYLLNTRAKLQRIIYDYCKDINEVKKAPELKLERDNGWEKGEERLLGCHLLEFTEALEESCLSVLPHILCEYVYDLSKKFNRYHSSVCKDGFVVEPSTLLLYEATAVVIEQCFQLLGINPTSDFFFSRSIAQPSLDLFSTVERPMNLNARCPHQNSRLQPFSFHTMPMMYESDRDSKLFGLISVSEKHELLSTVTGVPLFNCDLGNPVDMVDGELVFLGCPPVPLSAFTFSISVRMELYVTKKDTCYQVCKQNKVIDLSDFWGKKLVAECGCVYVKEGITYMYYIALKDAVDTAIEGKFRAPVNAAGRDIRGYVLAYYGDEFLAECESGPAKDRYYALLFLTKPPRRLLDSQSIVIESQLAVPATGRLIVKVFMQDCNTKEVIMNARCKFKAQTRRDSSRATVQGRDGCSFQLKIDWNYQDKYI